MRRWFYADSLSGFHKKSDGAILGEIASNSDFGIETTQRDAWMLQISILRAALQPHIGDLFFEYSIPRMGRRVDVLVIIDGVIFVVEFKVNAREYLRADVDQVWDYALDLKNFHEPTHERYVVPCLVATRGPKTEPRVKLVPHRDKTTYPIKTNGEDFGRAIQTALDLFSRGPIDARRWAKGRYCPTPTIIEAATALYNRHSVEDISRSDAGAINLRRTSQTITDVIRMSRDQRRKSICFVTGVPGAGKTLVGLNIATTHYDKDSDLYSVLLSGNGPLVKVLREALVRDKVAREKGKGGRLTKREASSEVKMFIQNVHNFRDDCLFDENRPPTEHVAIFDEAQRAWNLSQTAMFMSQKKKRPGFTMSEPEYLISCLDRHPDWAVVVCLVGGGQEINTGEAGITEWVSAIRRRFQHWDVWVSSQLTDSEYGAGEALRELTAHPTVTYEDDLHLAVSMRSFRAENVSQLVKQMLDLQPEAAAETLSKLGQYPIAITRDISKAKTWLREKARGNERFGIVASSQAERLRPYAIDIRWKIDPVHWFLNDREDVRSSYYLEDVATEFHIQGLELDWTCVTWDADLRFSRSGWIHKSFRGSRWQNIRSNDRRKYLENAYRVLLTRARQGMVVVVPPGDAKDHTRLPEFYDPTFDYLKKIGFPELP